MQLEREARFNFWDLRISKRELPLLLISKCFTLFWFFIAKINHQVNELWQQHIFFKNCIVLLPLRLDHFPLFFHLLLIILIYKLHLSSLLDWLFFLFLFLLGKSWQSSRLSTFIDLDKHFIAWRIVFSIHNSLDSTSSESAEKFLSLPISILPISSSPYILVPLICSNFLFNQFLLAKQWLKLNSIRMIQPLSGLKILFCSSIPRIKGIS